jgi:hypothetical protein
VIFTSPTFLPLEVGPPYREGLRASLDELMNREIFAPDGEENQFIGRWSLGRSVTIGTELFRPLIKRQKYNI